ncbi:hypothetical protein [Microbacterium sp. RG1]|uniref:hypothetical protein n=1 Tax=Microbacterium sp. RG1 TaxID=2489212 RepID=UPI0010CA49BE|nr:hypothetical protein [Microbacterium sp. RG1]QCQ17262.1 hypothetical protein EHF32_11300 [Microbacterium sp. RG1]
MPDLTATHVLTTDAVRWGIETLGLRKLHPTFVVYLYLRAKARSGTLSDASATSDELLSLIRMPGNPRKPYYFPLISRGQRADGLLHTFWRAPNIAGSWSPGSIHRQQSGAWLGTEDGEYAMPNDHTELAFNQMLFGEPVSALALGAYFLRNDGFVLTGTPTPEDLVAGFRVKFDFPSEAEDDFQRLFTSQGPDDDFAWFEKYPQSTVELNAEEETDV